MRAIWVRVRERWQRMDIATGGSPAFRTDDLLGRLLDNLSDRRLDLVLTSAAHKLGADSSIYVVRDCVAGDDWLALTRDLDPNVEVLALAKAPARFQEEIGVLKMLVRQIAAGRSAPGR